MKRSLSCALLINHQPELWIIKLSQAANLFCFHLKFLASESKLKYYNHSSD
ncbi:hypothetical protein PAGA_b0742 [Pseudoalteromonas agarivorans DSM 14585]|uniref:Uncharacterized protein n=1 Tax=Pseudoalteromonas agarivorans DSM 14585 TaxID=1312369 RepID=A0ACA8E2R7_9GAMM|nr:hypothetical protein PAGA_b0742 [Pseudoalteromonas agarivorans DSM 14585]ETJ49509.1 hypothetical protein X564_03855 [Pseudoalteromonas agarivorans]